MTDMKVIAIIRTSTFYQEIETQKRELLSFIEQDGYTERDIIWIGGQGISAIKESEEYEMMYQQLYMFLETNEVECVYAWELSRIGRREEPVIKLKNWLIKHGVQLRIKTPSLYLLNGDGTVNPGMEMALSMFLLLAKNEMNIKKERFRRTIDRLKSEGKRFAGIPPFGFREKDKYNVVEQEEMKLVKLIYTKYATGKYSMTKLAEDLYESGYTYRSRHKKGAKITYAFVSNILRNEIYWRFIDKDVVGRCNENRKGAERTFVSKERTVHMVQGLLKCPVCGKNYCSSSDIYRCIDATVQKRDGRCTNSITVQIGVIDDIAWKIAEEIHTRVYSEDRQKENEKNLADILVLTDKITVLEKEMQTYDKRIERMQNMYIDGEMSKQQYDRQKHRIYIERTRVQDKIDIYRADIDVKTNMRKDAVDIHSLSDMERKKIVHTYIRRIDVSKETYRWDDYRYGGLKKKWDGKQTYWLYRFDITTYDGRLITVRFRPKKGVYYN